MTLATLIFMGAAVALAAFLVVSGRRTAREDQRTLILAQEREHTARQNAERARAARALWEAKFAADLEAQREAAAADPRGVGDGLGRDGGTVPVPLRTGRFTRRDVPAPFIR